jgi:hypothetical protein
MALPDLTDLFVADSYKGVLHTSNIPFTGSNIPPIYDGLGNKSSLKLGSDGNGASISGCLSADCIDIAGFTLIDYLYPVGAVYLDTFDVNPQTRFTGTTWTKISEGKFLAGVGNGVDKNLTNQAFSAGDDVSIGEYGHTLTVAEMPSHSHGYQIPEVIGNGERDNNRQFGENFQNAITSSVGGDQSHNNIPPYFGVYIWKRLT